MELLDILLGGDDSSSNGGRNWDRRVFDTDRFSNNRSGNWVDWEDVSTGSYKGDGFEHPNHDEDEECWLIFENITKLEVIIQLKEYLW